MNQNTTKKKCHNCGSEWEVEAHYCGTCGTELIEEKPKEFGNGLPLKYFNFMYNILPLLTVVVLLFMTVSSYNDFILYYDSSLEFYFSFYSMRFNVLNLLINYILLGLTLYTRFKKNKIGFSKVMIYRLILAVLVPIASLIPIYLDFGITAQDIGDTMSFLISPLVMGIVSTIYLTKRFDFKWFDFSDIL